MQQIVRCGSADFDALTAIWERSVRATHSFLTENDIQQIKALLPGHYFPAVELFAIDADGVLKAFIGLAGGAIEMLFVDSDSLRKGYGRALTRFAIRRGATKVDVNEQNPEALHFYMAMGFRISRRTATDDAGRPFPILHLSL